MQWLALDSGRVSMFGGGIMCVEMVWIICSRLRYILGEYLLLVGEIWWCLDRYDMTWSIYVYLCLCVI